MFFEIVGNLNSFNETDVCLNICSQHCKVSCICFEPDEPLVSTRQTVLTDTLTAVRIEE